MYFSFQKQDRSYVIYKNATYTYSEPHVHSHLEIVFMREGGKAVGVADNKSAIIEEGDLFIAFPNQVHYYHDVVKPIKADIFIISPQLCPEFKKFFETSLPETPIIKNAKENPNLIAALSVLSSCNSTDDNFADSVVKGGVLILMGEYLRMVKLNKKSSHNTDTAKDIISFCYENYTGDISLSSVASALHISRYYVSHLFAERLNINFSDYINSLRIRKACELLKSSENSITEIAHAVGYNSVRTFDRCFVKIKGMTPREYRTKSLNKT